MMQLHYCGYNACNIDHDTIYRPNGSGDYLFLLLMTPMKIHLHNELIVTKPNACLLYSPDAFQHYQAVQKFKNSYIHFSADPEKIEKYNLPVNQIFYPSHRDEINHLIQQIHTEYMSKEIYFLEKISTLIEQLFVALARSFQQSIYHQAMEQTLFTQFQKARLHFLSNCEKDWNIENMCQLLNLSKSQFYYYYSLFFHAAPKAELIEARIEKAKHLLTNRALQVQQVSLLSGFQNIHHFTRYFTKSCGCTPSSYAKQIQEKNG